MSPNLRTQDADHTLLRRGVPERLENGDLPFGVEALPLRELLVHLPQDVWHDRRLACRGLSSQPAKRIDSAVGG